MSYGTIKVDTITFTDGGVDRSVSVSGLTQNPTITGNLTVTGTISGDIIEAGTSVSGVTVLGTSGTFTTLTGTTTQGTTASFTTGTFTALTGTTTQGTTSTYTTGSFTSLTGTTTQGTTASFTTGTFTTLTGTTTTGTTATFTSGSFTTLTGTTTSGTTANFVSGVFSTSVSGATVQGTAGDFTTITGGVATITSGVFALGTNALPSISFASDPNTGIYSPGADQVAISTNGTGRLFIDASGNVGVGQSGGARGGSGTRFLSKLASGQSFIEVQANGTADANALIFSDGSTGNYGAYGYNHSNDSAYIQTAGDTRLTILSDGKLGLGTSSPAPAIGNGATLHLYGASTTSELRLQRGNGTDLSLVAGSTVGGGSIILDNKFSISTDSNSTQAFTVDTSGHVGIGTSSFVPRFAVNNSVNGNAYADPASYYAAADNVGVYGVTRLNSGSLTANKTQVGVLGVGRTDNSGTPGSGNLIFGVLGAVSNGYGGGVNEFGIGCIGNGYISGSLGIGTQTPGEKLEVAGNIYVNQANPDVTGVKIQASTGTNAAAMQFTNTGGNFFVGLDSSTGGRIGAGAYAGGVWHEGSYPIGFGTNNQLRATIDSSGRLLVGTSSSTAPGSTLQVRNDSGAAAVDIYRSDATTGTSLFGINKSRGTAATPLIVAADDVMGYIAFRGYDGSSYVDGAYIHAAVDGTPGSNDMPGRLVFSTTADEASSPTERMRITNKGVLKATNTADYYAVTGDVHELRSGTTAENLAIFSHTGASPYGPYFHHSTDSNNTSNYFFTCVGNATTRATLRSNGGLANYQSNNVDLSDERAKRNIAPVSSTWTCVQSWDVVNYSYLDDAVNDTPRIGVIAQQVQQHCPEVVIPYHEAEDAVLDDDGNVVTPAKEERLGVREQQMMWMAIKALQEAQLRIETLEAEVAALKAA